VLTARTARRRRSDRTDLRGGAPAGRAAIPSRENDVLDEEVNGGGQNENR
jgi:hypothetical protein